MNIEEQNQEHPTFPSCAQALSFPTPPGGVADLNGQIPVPWQKRDYNQVEWLCIHAVRLINCPSGPLSLLALLLSLSLSLFLSFSFPIIHAPELVRGFYLPLVIRNPSYIIAFLVLEKWVQVSHFFLLLGLCNQLKADKTLLFRGGKDPGGFKPHIAPNIWEFCIWILDLTGSVKNKCYLSCYLHWPLYVHVPWDSCLICWITHLPKNDFWQL